MTTPHAPHNEFADLVARAREALEALAKYVERTDVELTDEQRREADALLNVHHEHRRGFHPPPS